MHENLQAIENFILKIFGIVIDLNISQSKSTKKIL